jgi:DNA-binding MarR family transcriptional regulator
VSEVTPRQQQAIESIIESLSALWDLEGPEVPAWAAQEMTFGQMRLVFMLSKVGPMTMSRIAEWLGVGLPTASGVVERVERHGLVTRQHRLDDRRIVECRLTDAGRRLVDEIAGKHLENTRHYLNVLNEDEMVELARLTRIVLERAAARLDRPQNQPCSQEGCGDTDPE